MYHTHVKETNNKNLSLKNRLLKLATENLSPALGHWNEAKNFIVQLLRKVLPRHRLNLSF